MSPGEGRDMVDEAPVSIDLKRQFVKEAAGRLKELETGLLNIEKGQDLGAQVRLIFRGFHGLKGIAAYVNAREIIDLTNAGESLLMKVRDEDEALRMANDSYFGLSASVWSQDTKRAMRIAENLEVGSVNINDAVAHFAVPLLPFGGKKLSGDARIHGSQEILQFTQDRSYVLGKPPLPLI